VVMRSSVIAACLGMVVAGPAAAQTSFDAQVSPEMLRQVQKFEITLRAAIVTAGQRLGERAREVVPDIEIRFEMLPQAQGVVLPDGTGLLFLVDLPAIEATSVTLWDLSRRNLGSNPVPRVSNSVAVPPPASDAVLGPPITNPELEYAEYTRQALMDALLDQAFALPIKESQSLTLSVRVVSPLPANPLGPLARRLYLRIKGEDLLALRQNRITREEAMARILESRY